MRREIAIVGNNLAALVAAQSLAESGNAIALVNPAPTWGGHFAGVQLGARHFDPGMVLYEFDSFNCDSAQDLRTYDPSVRNDSGRFVRQVRDFVSARVRTVQVPDPCMYFEGRVYPDLIIANRLEAITLFDAPLRDSVAAELGAICAAPPMWMHASQKACDDRFDAIDFESVSLANHGRTLHEHFFDPLCRKIVGVSPARILARFHRAAWMPLYYPETLLSQFGPVPQRLPATHFHYPLGGSASALVRVLAAEVQAHPNVRVVRKPLHRIRTAGPVAIEFADGSDLEPAELVWTLDQGALIALADEHAAGPVSSRASIGLCFIALPSALAKRAFSTVFIVDPERSIYRVTDQEICSGADVPEHRLVAEFSPAALTARVPSDPAALQHALLEELAEMGLIDAPASVAYCSVRILPNALMIPDDTNRTIFAEQRARLLRYLPAVHLIGLSAGFHAGSMNDQIAQGLKLGALLGSRPT